MRAAKLRALGLAVGCALWAYGVMHQVNHFLREIRR